jgi:hypothetical protein
MEAKKMAQMSYKQRQYIQSLATKLDICTFEKLNAIANRIGAKTWQMMNTDQASQMIFNLKKAVENPEYREKLEAIL